MDIISNPVIIGLISGLLSYAYLKYKTDETNENNLKKSKKGKKAKPFVKQEINLLIPLTIAIIAWFIAYMYIDYNSQRITVENPIDPKNQYQFEKEGLSLTSDAHSFELINNGVTIPKNLPDVLLDMM